MSLLDDLNVSHNLSSDPEAKTTLESMFSIIDSLPSIDHLLRDKENWDTIAQYKDHTHEIFLDEEDIEGDYDHFIEGDVTGFPSEVTLTFSSQCYTLDILHKGKLCTRKGSKHFRFNHKFELIERVEEFEQDDDLLTVRLGIDGSKIISTESYNPEGGEIIIRKDIAYSKRKIENALLMTHGWLVPSEDFVEYCKEKLGKAPNESELIQIVREEGLNESDIDFNESKAYFKDETLKVVKVKKQNLPEIIDTVNNFTSLYIHDDQLNNFDGKLKKLWKKVFGKRTVTKDYPAVEVESLRMEGSSAKVGAGGQLMSTSIHDVIHSDLTFDDIGGQEVATELARELVREMKQRKKLIRMGMSEFNFGIGLYGPPGTGKSLLARIIAHEAGKNGRPLLALSASALNEQLVGVGSGRLRALFDHARRVNGIIFIDEIDSIAKPRTEGNSPESGNTLNTLLTEMEGIKGSGTDVIWATNLPFDKLDSALINRTPYKIYMDAPDHEGRKEIFMIHARDKRFNYSALAEIDYYAKLMEGSGSGRNIRDMLKNAMRVGFRTDATKIYSNALQTAFEEVLFGIGSGNKVLQGKCKEVTAYHEAGHAIVAYYAFEKGERAFKDYINMITIRPMGGMGGFVFTRSTDPFSEEFMRTQYLGQLALAMAGLISEKMHFEDMSPGASSDLDKVRDLSKSLVLAGVTLDGSIYLDEEEDGFKRARSNLVHRAYKQASDILETNKDKVRVLANALMQETTIYRDRFTELMEG